MKKTVVGHDRRGPEAAALCDGLAAALKTRLPGLEVGQSQNWCSFAVPGMTRFAYLKHKQRQGSVEVWFAGDHHASALENSLIVRERQETRGGFGPAFRARFEVGSVAQVAEAAELLAQVSCPATHAKSNLGRPAYGVKTAPTESARSGEATGHSPQEEG